MKGLDFVSSAPQHHLPPLFVPSKALRPNLARLFWSGSSFSVQVGGSWLNWAAQGPFPPLLLSYQGLVLNVGLGNGVPHGPGLLAWAKCGPVNPLCSPGMTCLDSEPCVSTSQAKHWTHPCNFGSKIVPIQRLEQQHPSINFFLFIDKFNLNFAVAPQVCL